MESNIQNFYKNKVVFLTGGTGFLGKGVLKLKKKNNKQLIKNLVTLLKKNEKKIKNSV